MGENKELRIEEDRDNGSKKSGYWKAL